MSAAKATILLCWFVLAANLCNVSALTPGAGENCIWEKSLATVEARQAKALETAGRHQENGGAAYDNASASLLAAETIAPKATQLEFQFAPQVEQYALRAKETGFYPVMVRGSDNAQFITLLNKGDVWKFGTTVNPATRYSGSYLQSIGDYGVEYSTEFLGTEQQAVQLQNMKILNYRLQKGWLPPGNKVVN